MGLPYYEMAGRCIAVLYLMSGGDEKAPLEKEEFFRQCNHLKVFEMSNKEFQRFKMEHIDVQSMVKKDSIWPKK